MAALRVSGQAPSPLNAGDDGNLAVLRAEAEGVLAWAVAGALQFYAEGLGEAAAVEEATREYRAEQDVLAAFLVDACEVAPDAEALGGKLYEAFVKWAKANGDLAFPSRPTSSTRWRWTSGGACSPNFNFAGLSRRSTSR